MEDNTKAAGDTSANYSFAYSVEFIRDLVEQMKMRDDSYAVDGIDFKDKDIDN